jgi:hypothetical protein
MIHAGGTFIAILTVAVAFWVVPYGWRAIEYLTRRTPSRFLAPDDEMALRIALSRHPAGQGMDARDAAWWAELDALAAWADWDRLTADSADEDPP